MRIGVAYLIQETNSFSPIPTRLEDFGWLSGSAALEKWRGSKTEVGAFIDGVCQSSAQLVPLFAGWAITQGPILAEDFEEMKLRVHQQIQQAGNLDGLLLALHGAMCAEGEDDCAGAILQQIREVTGLTLPVILTLDLHANVTRRIVQLANAVIGYKTYPHVDFYDTGWTAACLLDRALRKEVFPLTAMRKLPLIVPAEEMQTREGPMEDVFTMGKFFQTTNPGILDVSVFGVQPWLDIEEMGCSTVVVYDGEKELAQECCDQMARKFWDLRDRFDIQLPSPREAIEIALKTKGQPVVLSESSDSPTAGSPGDSADMVRAVLELAPGVSAAAWVRDPVAVGQCWELTPGSLVQLEIGGKFDKRHRRPVSLCGVVRSSSDGRFVPQGAVYHGMELDMGRTVVVEAAGLSVVLSEKAVPVVNPELYRSQGIEPLEKKIVIVKSPRNFRSEYGSFAARLLVVDTPGISSANIRRLPFRRISRPIHPLDRVEFVID